ncbi:hypothetical protein NDU88_008700 [Pleurodeles waltl]|uniref:Uncharacterized protein n=1 Tax=Pleurodeles waltl TaxID=8319 RepID=A0AAV7QRF4_PLEWA|nr:hypothetical protein NDU88_008700 [Pleurodeles waltl]
MAARLVDQSQNPYRRVWHYAIVAVELPWEGELVPGAGALGRVCLAQPGSQPRDGADYSPTQEGPAGRLRTITPEREKRLLSLQNFGVPYMRELKCARQADTIE